MQGVLVCQAVTKLEFDWQIL